MRKRPTRSLADTVALDLVRAEQQAGILDTAAAEHHGARLDRVPSSIGRHRVDRLDRPAVQTDVEMNNRRIRDQTDIGREIGQDFRPEPHDVEPVLARLAELPEERREQLLVQRSLRHCVLGNGPEIIVRVIGADSEADISGCPHQIGAQLVDSERPARIGHPRPFLEIDVPTILFRSSHWLSSRGQPTFSMSFKRSTRG
jgi:hypothetical protein